MAESNKSGAITSRAGLNVQLSVGNSQFHRDLRRHLRNCAGTIPFYDPLFLNSFAPKLFEGAPFMSGIFLGIIKSFPDKIANFGNTKIEVPFHTLDCGLCMYLACFVSSSLGSRHYQGPDFMRLHSNLQHRLTIHQVGSEREAKTTLAAHKFCVKESHSYWVVSAIRGYAAAKAIGASIDMTDEKESVTVEPIVTFPPESVEDEPMAEEGSPDYQVLSPAPTPVPTPSAPRRKAKGKKKVAAVPADKPVAARELFRERRSVKAMPSVFTDSSDESSD
jgi:hypothetical protein